jgi:hypothetical protein
MRLFMAGFPETKHRNIPASSAHFIRVHQARSNLNRFGAWSAAVGGRVNKKEPVDFFPVYR